MQRLDGLANARPANRKLFCQLFFGGKSLARFDLASFDEAEYVSDKQAACFCESYHNCFVHYSQLLSAGIAAFEGKNGIQRTLREVPPHVAKICGFE